MKGLSTMLREYDKEIYPPEFLSIRLAIFDRKLSLEDFFEKYRYEKSSSITRHVSNIVVYYQKTGRILY